MTQASITIERVDYRALTDEQLRILNEFENVMQAEEYPDDPPKPLEQTVAFTRNLPGYFVVNELWALDANGKIAAEGFTYWTDTEENSHLANIGLLVRPDRRRRGLGRVLLRSLTEVASSAGRELLLGMTSNRVPAGQAFARRVGAEPGLATHENRLQLVDVDREMVARWISQGPQRAAGYSVVWMDNPYPDDRIEAIADLMNVMNTAPRDDLDMEDQRITADHVRQWERSRLASGTECWNLFAVEDATGGLVGYTAVRWNSDNPAAIMQGDTGVRPEHRGHALGKWLKAAMIDRILRERPEADHIRTGNADSNDAMLGINRELGFKPYIARTAWQVRVERVQAYLDGSSV